MKSGIKYIKIGVFSRLIIYPIIFIIFTNILDLRLMPALGCVYGLYVIDNLMINIGKHIPIIELMLALYGLQLLISPALDYYIFNWAYPSGQMKVDDNIYYSFAFFAVLAFHIGIVLVGRLNKVKKLETQIIERIYVNRVKNLKNAWILIIIGIVFTELMRLPIPGIIAFIAITFSNFKFIGFFYLYFSKSRYIWVALLIIFVPFTLDAVQSVMFIDIIIWGFLLLSIMLRGRKVPRLLILSLGILGFAAILILQSVKREYRELAWNGKEVGFSTFTTLVKDKFQNMTYEEFHFTGGFINTRFNQGWIITDVQIHLSEYPENFSYGRWFFKEVVGVLLPRFVYPNKPVVADKDKYEQFTGRRLAGGTTMTVSILGDGYGNFGRWGGIIFCLFFGIAIGHLRYKVYNLAVKRYPALLCWTPVIFFYIMRPGNDFYMIMNYMVKVWVLAVIFFYMTDNKFYNWKQQTNIA